jgi:PAS domain S-box-containing protein
MQDVHREPTAHSRLVASSGGAPDFERFRPLCLALSALAFLVGLIAMAGWIFQQPHWRSFLASGSEMKPNTALVLMLLSSAIFLRWGHPVKLKIRAAKFFSAITGFIAIAILCEYLFEVNFGIDELLFKDVQNPVGTSHPGRMSIPSAWSFLFGAIAVFLLNFQTSKGARPAQWLALLMAAVPGGILICYVYGNMNVLAFGKRNSYMALPTAAALVTLAIAILLHAPNRGLMRPITSRNQSGRMFRRLLIALLILPPLLGWFVLVFLNGHESPAEFGVGATVMLSIVILAIVAWISAVSLSRSEETRSSAEAALLESEDRFHTMADNIAQLAWMADADGHIFFYNQRWYDYTGTTFAEMQGWGWEKVHEPTELQRMLPRWKAALATGEPWQDTFPLRGRDGKYRWFLSRAFPIKDASGKVIRWFGSNTDIHDIRATEEALREREAVLRTVTSEARVGLVMVNQDREYLFANNTYTEILGITDKDIIGKRVPDVLPRVYEEQIKPRLDSAFAGERLCYELRIAAHSRTGQERVYEVTYQPRMTGAERYVIVVIVDITDRKKAQKLLERTVNDRTIQLREANENLQTFAYTAAHDLRSPLRSISAFSGILLEEYGGSLDANAKSYLSRISQSTGQMERLLVDLLEYSKISQSEVRLVAVNLQGLVANALDFLDNDIRAKQASIQVASAFPSVVAHPATLTLLIQNLVSNALKFIPNGTQPRIVISTAPAGQPTGDDASPTHTPADSPVRNSPTGRDSEPITGFVRLCVQDNGIGIEPENVKKLFIAFQRLHGKEEYPGTGLGLAMVRKGAERMGGRVGVESEPGKGSTFWIELPVAGP